MNVNQKTTGIHIPSFIYCDKVEQVLTPNGPFWQIVKPLDELTPVALPGNYSFAASCIITGIQQQTTNHVVVVFSDPDGEVVAKFDMPECVAPNDLPDKNETCSLQSNFDFRNVILAKAGKYTTTILFNGDEIGVYEISVRAAGMHKNKETK